MALAGLGWDELAAKIDRPGLGATKLRSDPEPRRYVLDAVVEACGVRADFFDLPLGADESQEPDLAERVDLLAEAVVQLASGNASRALREARAAADQAFAESPPGHSTQGRSRG